MNNIELNAQFQHLQLRGQIMASASQEVKISLQDKTVTPTAEEQVIEADGSFDGLNTVTIPAEPNFIAKNLRYGKSFWGIDGEFVGGGIAVASAVGSYPTVYKSNAQTNIYADNIIITSEVVGVVTEWPELRTIAVPLYPSMIPFSSNAKEVAV